VREQCEKCDESVSPQLTNAVLPISRVAWVQPRALAQEPGSKRQGRLSYGAETEFNSNYVGRGMVLDDRPVAQPSAWIELSGLSLTFWSALALSASPERERVEASGAYLTIQENCINWRFWLNSCLAMVSMPRG